MGLHVGIDVGSTNACVAVYAEKDDGTVTRNGTLRIVQPRAENGDAYEAPWRRALDVFERLRAEGNGAMVRSACVVGTGGRALARAIHAPEANTYRALAAAVGHLHPEARTVLRIGAETSSFLGLDWDADTGSLAIHDFARSGDCAAGTGSFLDTQAQRLGIPVEQIGEEVERARSSARIAGRCSVFAESDMIHAQQRGHTPAEVLRGLCDAIAGNLKNELLKGHDVVPPVLLLGGVALNQGVVRALRDALDLESSQLVVPAQPRALGAIGAALLARDGETPSSRKRARRATTKRPAPAPAPSSPLCRASVQSLRDDAASEAGLAAVRTGYLGIDVGSISTNVVLLDERGRVRHESYLRTAGRPVDAVKRGLDELVAGVHADLDLLGVGSTGSGRELLGEVVGADVVCDEITAHKVGAVHVARTAGGPMVDTIFEIGGQDSKFIALEDGIVVDFAMNEACAAGTGSFLEEQADRLGISIEKEFARLAFDSTSPCALGERCTVFMGREVVRRRQQGATTPDLAAGLAQSVALNYLNRVVRGRRIGDVIYFQGGTAYNDAVAAAFATLTGKPVTVPPHCGVMGAIGAALMAREAMAKKPRPTRFRGYDLDAVPIKTRTFVCKGCSNQCDIKQFTIEGQKSYWGDRCSERYRRPVASDRRPVIQDLLAHREQAWKQWMDGEDANPDGRDAAAGVRIGVPRCSAVMDRPVFWHTYLRALGMTPILSARTDVPTATRGAELSIAAPCYPIQVAHGHVEALLDTGVEAVLVPNVRDEAVEGEDGLPSHLCPWNQVLPFILRSCPGLDHARRRLIAPTVHFRQGRRHVERALMAVAARLGVSPRRNREAVRIAYGADRAFRADVRQAGADALRTLRSSGEPGVVLLGRSYNLYDEAVNCGIPQKLRRRYGVNVIPQDYLVSSVSDVGHLHPNMYWASGRRILAAAERVRRTPQLHAIYITNFKCGPDSYLKSIVRTVLGAPLLHLQFDGHGGDAGYLTRCEAFLESKGILRC